MALTPCMECRYTISDKAVSCPKCGFVPQVTKTEKRDVPLWAQVAALLLIPVGTTIIGAIFAHSQGGKEVDAKLIEVATGVLSTEPEKGSTELRQWARATINRYAEDTLPQIVDSVRLPAFSATRGDPRRPQDVTQVLRIILDALDTPIQIRLVQTSQLIDMAAVQDSLGPMIIYNPEGVLRLQSESNSKWTLTTMLAHEAAHIVLGHFEISSRTADQARRLELEADSLAGVTLRRLGASLEDAKLLMNALPESPQSDDYPYPSRENRVRAVEAGWRTGVSTDSR